MPADTTTSDLRVLRGALRRGRSPRDVLRAVDQLAWLPDGTRERIHGWGIMGQPFDSGHVLGLRRWSASSVGPAYTTVWHRSPEGRWAFWSTEAPEVSCNRYAGERVDDTATTEVKVSWLDGRRVDVAVPAFDLVWQVRLASSPVTRLLNAVAAWMPDRVRRDPRILAGLGPVAGRLLGAGPLGITGGMPNGQRFDMTPYHLWLVDDTSARLRGEDLGRPAPLRTQARIGDFLVPQRGIVAVGTIFLEPLDPRRHSMRLSRAQHRPCAP